MQNKVKTLLASLIGNILEYYDFAVFTISIPIIVDHFFSPISKNGINLAVTIFFLGIIFRFFGGLLFGYIGDKYGRKKVLTSSLLLTGICTTIIGVLPTYSHIGILSSIIFITVRIIQGLCLGGEAPNASIFLIEHFKGKAKGKIGSLAVATSAFGTCLAISVVYACRILIENKELAWRIPYLIGGFTAFAGLYIRLNVMETTIFKNIIAKKNLAKLPIKELINNHYQHIILAIAISCFTGIMSSTITGYFNIYLQKVVQIGSSEALLYSFLTTICFIVFLLIAGVICDIVGPRNLFNSSCFVSILITPMIFYCLTSKIYILLALICFSALSAGVCSCIYSYLFTLFEPSQRCSGFSFCINSGNAIMALFSDSIHRIILPTNLFYQYTQIIVIMTICLTYLILSSIIKHKTIISYDDQ